MIARVASRRTVAAWWMGAALLSVGAATTLEAQTFTVTGSVAPTYVSGRGTVYFPHGGWVQPLRYYYLPRIGFGRDGLFSWYYGGPYPYAYPYAYYLPHYTPASPYGTYVVTWFQRRPYYRFYPWDWVVFRRGGLPAYQLRPFPWDSGSPGAVFGSGNTGWYGEPFFRDTGAASFPPSFGGEPRTADKPLESVELQIEPADAVLYLDGNLIGNARYFSRRGATLQLPAGKYLLEASLDGYAPLSVEIEVKAGQKQRIEQRLERSGSGEQNADPGRGVTERAPDGRPCGRLLLKVTPDDARVRLDGRFLCFGSPVPDARFLHGIPAGPHSLEVTREGYRPVLAEILVSPLRPVERTIALERQ